MFRGMCPDHRQMRIADVEMNHPVGSLVDRSIEPERLRALGVRALLVKRGPGSSRRNCGWDGRMRCGRATPALSRWMAMERTAIPRLLDELEAGCDLVPGSRCPGQTLQTRQRTGRKKVASGC